MAIPVKKLEGKRGINYTDSLIDLCEKGGEEGPLALISLFHLMIKKNIEYPEFYTKLYSYFTEDILHASYWQKFIHWANIFLSSTHVSSILVSAFIKRAARLALRADSGATLDLIKLVGNLLIRHPSLSHFRHQEMPKEIQEDPYDPLEPDPLKSHSMESALWEVKTLENHWHPEVFDIARCIMRRKVLPDIEWTIAEEEQAEESEMRKEHLMQMLADAPMDLGQKPIIDDVVSW